MRKSRRRGRAAPGQAAPPEGKIRQSQMVTTYGAGSMVDLLDHSVLIGGLDFWRYPNDQDTASYIPEPRLRDSLAPKLKAWFGLELDASKAFRAPPRGDERQPAKYSGVRCARFPYWFVCQRCRALKPAKSLEEHRSTLRHQCSRDKVGECTPVRFVAACRRGHLEEFPWVAFVHEDGERCAAPELRLEEGASGDFSEIVVRCETCGKKRALSSAMAPNALPPCRGRRPWLGPEADEPDCEERLQLLVRTASNAYFAQIVSALSIPDPAHELVERIAQPDVFSVLRAATAENLDAFRQIPHVKLAIEGHRNEQVLRAVRSVLEDKPVEAAPIRVAEYTQLLAQRTEVGGELPPQNASFWARRLADRTKLPAGVGPIVLAKKLREVRVQVGFSRFRSVNLNAQGEYESDAELAPLGLNTSWLPASEILGEGVLICLDEAALRRWEERPAVRDRRTQLLAGHEAATGSAAGFPGMRFYLLHSLSHLLINAISIHSGYAASAIRERIYSEEGGPQPMAGILLHTGTSGADGTLGGLVEQGRRMGEHLERAREYGMLCSNDPVCARHQPVDHAERYLEGAACHGCLFVAECSCEHFNRYLDRALVVPTLGHPPELAFFP